MGKTSEEEYTHNRQESHLAAKGPQTGLEEGYSGWYVLACIYGTSIYFSCICLSTNLQKMTYFYRQEYC